MSLRLSNPDERNDPPRPLMEHLLALRDMIIFGAISWAICVIFCAFFSNDIVSWLQLPMQKIVGGDATAQELAVKGPMDGIVLAMSVSFWSGTAVAFPFIMFAILRFVFPALTKREKIVILSILVVGTAFFVSGIVLAYQQTLPTMLQVLRAINGWMGLTSDFYFASDYIPVIIKTIFAFGLVFQLPLILFILGWFGIISSKTLREKRRVAIVLAFVLSMFLTPPDPMSQIIMAVPLCILYELSIWAIWLKERA